MKLHYLLETAVNLRTELKLRRSREKLQDLSFFDKILNSTFENIDSNEDAYFGRDAMHSALNSDNPELLKLVIAAGGNVNIALGEGWTPLHEAFDYAIDG